MTNLTAERVSNTVKACLYDQSALPADGSAPEGAILVHGVVSNFGFDPKKVAVQKPVIAEMLNELPENFRMDAGGGWSFLMACNDKNDEQWGEHRNIDELVCLGIAAGLVDFLLPREMWKVLPGGMPYFGIKTEAA